MVLQFFTGNPYSQHLSALAKETAEWLQLDSKRQVFYLVPNHIKFDAEVAVLSKLHELEYYQKQTKMAAMRLQVFSFSRLGWFFLQNTADYPKESLSEVGNKLLIAQALRDSSEELQLFKGEVDQAGFVAKLASLFAELDQGLVGAEDLLDFHGDQVSPNLEKKVADLKVLYENYLKIRAAKEMRQAQLLKNLKNDLEQTDLSEILFVISGFSRFTAEEAQLVETLLAKAGKVVLDLNVDKAYLQPPEKYQLFHNPGKFYFEMYQLARKKGVAILRDKKLPQQTEIAQDLLTLSDYWDASSQLTPPRTFKLENPETIQIWQAPSLYHEIQQVAGEIVRLVASGKYRYRDILVLSRDFANYQSTLVPLFQKNDIPYYLDETLSMKNHPLVVFFQSLFAIHDHYYRYEDLFRFLRTQLFLPDYNQTDSLKMWQEKRQTYQQKVDVTENVVLAYGYEGSVWTKGKDWRYIHYDYEGESFKKDENQTIETLSNGVRRDIFENLPNFYQTLQAAKTGEEAATILYQFLEKIHLEEQIKRWRDLAIEAGELDAAAVHQQTWNAFVELLDEYVLLFGDTAFHYGTFTELFKTGLESITYSRVPASLDQVVCSPLDRLHVKQGKVTFIIGATDQALPKRIENDTLLKDDERQLINERLSPGKYLEDNSANALAKEPYTAYLAMTSATQKLYFSYPLKNEIAGEDLKISPYVQRIAENLKVQIKQTTEADALAVVSRYPQLISSLVTQERQALDEGRPLPAFWQRLQKIILRNSKWQVPYQKAQASLTAVNLPHKLEKEQVVPLYGETLYGSVSRFEEFYQCQYKYFLNYGLRLKEREVLELSAITMGNFFHSALDTFFKVLKAENLNLSQLSQAELQKVTTAILVQTLGEERFSILNSNHRMNYIRYQLQKTIQRVIWALQKQQLRSQMTPLATEVLFGEIAKEQGLQALKFQTSDGHKIQVRGKIDRIDQVTNNETAYLSVVDYKSSPHKFQIGEMYYGLAMQMITYLDVALENAVQILEQNGYSAKLTVKPGGAFYYHVQNPVLKAQDATGDISEKLLSTFKYQGILLNEPAFLETLDTTLENGETSDIHYVKLGKKTDEPVITTKERSYSLKELQQLLQHNRSNLKNAGEQIYRGEIRLNPVRIGKRTPCTYCQYKSVCQFDNSLPENNYQDLPNLKKAEVFHLFGQKKTEEEEKDDENSSATRE